MSTPLKYLILHCTATQEGINVSAKTIEQFHRSPEILKDGTGKILGYQYCTKKYNTIEELPNDFICGDSIKDLAKRFSGRGWSRTGYSRLYLLNGSKYEYRIEDGDQLVEQNEYTFGTLKSNYEAFHWCYVGGLAKDGRTAKDTITDAQFIAMEKDIKQFIAIHPQIKVAGHRDFDLKACPSFDVTEKMRLMGIPEINILIK
jgi:hypothetical protein